MAVKNVGNFVWKMWDAPTQTMLTSQQYEKGYRKMYPVETDRGQLDVSSAQMGQMLEAVMQGGQSDVIDQSFSVKSNGKSGKEIRYYINAVFDKPEQEAAPEPVEQAPIPNTLENDDKPIDLSDIPF